jgi:hypothetical protein
MEIKEKLNDQIVGVLGIFFLVWLISTQIQNSLLLVLFMLIGLLVISYFRRRILFVDNEIKVEYFGRFWNKGIPYTSIKKISFKKEGVSEYKGTVIRFFYENENGRSKVFKVKIVNQNELLYVKSFIKSTFGGIKDDKV